MSIYVLDRNFVKIQIVENYTSFIWTEKVREEGNFVLSVPIRSPEARQLQPGYYLYLESSRTLMAIERSSRDSSASDGNLLNVSGRSIHSLFRDKISKARSHNSHVGWIAYRTVIETCILGEGVSSRDVIPNLTSDGSMNIGTVLDYSSGMRSVYDTIIEMTSFDNLVFHMDFDYSSKEMTFRIREGVDRTDTLIFGPELGNLDNISHLQSIEEFKNVAYVYHRDRPGVVIVYRSAHSGASGIDRRVVYVDASSDRDWNEWRLQKAGIDALVQDHGYVSLIDGEVISYEYKYNVHYRLGDVVTVVDDAGRTNQARVSEYIWSYDNDGLREYPTFESFDPFTWSAD